MRRRLDGENGAFVTETASLFDTCTERELSVVSGPALARAVALHDVI
jgi:hypothetical protein